jgi:SRSO17 transposase
MVAAAAAEGVPFRWVGGDGVYGDSPTFVQGVRQLEKWYVLDSSADARVWTAEPRVIPADERPKPKRGRPCTQPLVVGEPQRVDEVVAALPAGARRRPTVAEGSQGPRAYEYAEVWARFSEEGLPGPRERLLVRRSLGQEPELKHHRSNAPAEVPLLRLAQVRATRWTIEEDIKPGKGQCGLDEYETRGWRGWHHHTALSMPALAFPVLRRSRLGGKRAGDDRARGAGPAGPPAGGARLGRGRDPQAVGLASGEESSSGSQPSQAASRRAKAAPTK